MPVKEKTLGHKHNYWYSQGAFRCKKCGHVTYKSEKGPKYQPVRNYKLPVIASIIIGITVLGFFVYQTYGTPQAIQNEANKAIQNTGNTIQQITSQGQQSLSNLQTTIKSSTNQDNRVPIAVYYNCDSTIRADLKEINTSCHMSNFQLKKFLFVLPSEIESHMQPSEAILSVSTKVYQYGDNDFKIWLSDQTGGKNYTVNLSQLPTSSGLNLPTFKYGASENFVQSTNILTTSVRSTVIPWDYTVIIKDSNGNVMKDETFTANEPNGLDVKNFDLTGIQKPAYLTILVDGTVIYTAYIGSPFAEPQTQQ